MKQVTPVARYHPALITLHWLSAILIIGMLGIGFLGLSAMSNHDPKKIALLGVHMAIGAAILLLMLARFIVRLKTSKPPRASTGYVLLDRLAPITHYSFYLLVVLMVATGFATAILSGLNLIVFGASQAPFPSDLLRYPTFVTHHYVAVALVGLITLHVLAALYHQFAIKDGLLRRMWYRPRTSSVSLSTD
jgi:cytochrome b561